MGQYDIEVKEMKPTTWVYKNPDGSTAEREQSQEERQEQIVPPKGEYVFKVKAFAKPFEMAKSEKYGGGMQMMTRLLLEIVSGPSPKAKGHITSALCSLAMSSGSNLGRVYMATTGKQLVQGTKADPVDMLEGEFQVYAKQDKLDENGNRKSTVLAWDTVGKPGESMGVDEDDDFAH